MIDVSVGSNENERQVLKLIRAMETGDLPAVVTEVCHEDFIWANSGLQTISGLAELRAQMARGGFSSVIPILASMTHFSADLLNIASNGDVVFTERVDHHWDEAGRDLMTPHICGVAELREGKITAFRDFFDTICFEQSPTGIQPGFALNEWDQTNSMTQ